MTYQGVFMKFLKSQPILGLLIAYIIYFSVKSIFIPASLVDALMAISICLFYGIESFSNYGLKSLDSRKLENQIIDEDIRMLEIENKKQQLRASIDNTKRSMSLQEQMYNNKKPINKDDWSW